MKKYDERFNERRVRKLYYEENMTAKEISKIVNIPIKPLCKRMNECGIKLSKIRYEICGRCKTKVPRHIFSKHIRSHIWAIRHDARCRWCKSNNVVKDGFCKIKGEKKQCLLCKKCGRTTIFKHKRTKAKRRTPDRCRIAFILRKSGYTFIKITEFMYHHYELKIDSKTAWNWVKIAEKLENQ